MSLFSSVFHAVWRVFRGNKRSIFLASSGIFFCTQPVSLAYMAFEQADQEWREFRQAFPYHLQSIGLTEPLLDGSRVLIVSEPPPHAEVSAFQSFASSLAGDIQVKTNTIGYDGWTKDIVISVPSVSDEELASKVDFLSQYLYGSSYKASILQLPIEQALVGQSSLNMSVTAADLQRWMFQEDGEFLPGLGGGAVSFEDILEQGKSGTFFSNDPGLVIWSIPRDGILANYWLEARRFFLDSDLILGAVANETQIAIVARERVESLVHLPPLRTETAMLLAAEQSKDLGQSYERNHLLAGRITDGIDTGWDWAPIYLSDNLLNSEFGSLLNITDQLLKSWSLNGATQYINFDYPFPKNWATFPSSLESFASVLFNWNTNGVSYVASFDGYDFLSLHQTGSLPIKYEAGDELLEDHEKIAYQYFSNLSNPDLVRVVQYTALFQIFKAFEVSTPKIGQSYNLELGEQYLELEILNILSQLEQISVEELAEVSIPYIIREASFLLDLIEQANDPELNALKDQDPENFLYGVLGYVTERVAQVKGAIDIGKATWPDDALPTLARFLANPREYDPGISERDFIRALEILAEPDSENIEFSPRDSELLREFWIFSTHEQITDPLFQAVLSEFFRVGQIKEQYVSVLADRDAGWIRTPSIVLSRDLRNPDSIGGHNISSTVTRLNSDSTIPVGNPKLISGDGGLTILHHPDDFDRIHSLSRLIATEGDNPNIQGLLGDGMNPPPPRLPPSQTLNYPEDPSMGRGLQARHQSQAPLLVPGWRKRPGKLNSAEQQRLASASESLDTPSVFIERTDNRYVISSSEMEDAFEASTWFSSQDALGTILREYHQPGSSVSVFVKERDLSVEEADALSLTLQQQDFDPVVTRMRSNHSFDSSIPTLNKSFNWTSAEVSETQISDTQALLDVSIPMASQQDSLSFRVKVFFKKPLSSLSQFIRGLGARVLGRQSSDATLNEVVNDIKSEFKKIDPDARLHIEYESEGFDQWLGDPRNAPRIGRR